MKRWLHAAFCAALAACGGGDDDDGGGGGPGDNRAVDTEFDFGSPTSATSTQANVLQTTVANVVSLEGTPNASSAVAVASFTNVTSTLLGSGFKPGELGAAPSILPQGYEDCITVTATRITYDNCTITSSGTTSVTDGFFDFSAGGASWDFTISVEVNVSGASSSGTYHWSGDLTVGGGTISGQMLGEWNIESTYGGTTYAYEMSEALILDLTYQSSPACVISGTLEARRVWTRRPNGVSEQNAPDRAVLITWTGCGVATVAQST